MVKMCVYLLINLISLRNTYRKIITKLEGSLRRRQLKKFTIKRQNKMTHEKIFIRGDRTKLKVIVELYTTMYSNDRYGYRVCVAKCEPRKRTWHYVLNTDDYRYRQLNASERVKWENDLYLELLTPEEILEAKMELWNKIKPE